MRSSFAAGVGMAAVLVLAACSPDQSSQQPLAPTVPSFASSPQCAGGLASDIAKTQKDLYTGAALTDVQAKFDAVKAACPGAANNDALMNYLEATITYRPDNVKSITEARAKGIVHLWAQVTLYFTNDSIARPFTVLTDSGGAEVLSPGESLITFDNAARLTLDPLSTPGGQHLFTFERRPTADCDGFTSLRVTGTGGVSLQGNGTGCYQVSDYPHEASYSPKATLTMCMLSGFGDVGIVHNSAFLSGEVLAEPAVAPPFFDCSTFHASNNWLRQNGGPLGRALASAYDYLAPRPLFASDAGTSGSMGDFSLVGGALQYVFQDDFDEINTPPDIGDAWTVDTTFPGSIQIVNGEVVLNQAQGNCTNCFVFQLLGTRVNSSQVESIGSYEVRWTSRQTKPSVKQAPFVVLNNNGDEIARLSYTTVSSQNRIIFTVNQPGVDSVYDVGTWVQNVNQTFKITVNTTVLGTNDNTVSFESTGLTTISNQPAPFATTLKQIGYVLTGWDAGIIVSDNWSVFRKNDVP